MEQLYSLFEVGVEIVKGSQGVLLKWSLGSAINFEWVNISFFFFPENYWVIGRSLPNSSLMDFIFPSIVQELQREKDVLWIRPGNDPIPTRAWIPIVWIHDNTDETATDIITSSQNNTHDPRQHIITPAPSKRRKKIVDKPGKQSTTQTYTWMNFPVIEIWPGSFEIAGRGDNSAATCATDRERHRDIPQNNNNLLPTFHVRIVLGKWTVKTQKTATALERYGNQEVVPVVVREIGKLCVCKKKASIQLRQQPANIMNKKVSNEHGWWTANTHGEWQGSCTRGSFEPGRSILSMAIMEVNLVVSSYAMWIRASWVTFDV